MDVSNKQTGGASRVREDATLRGDGVYERIRSDIVQGLLPGGSRLIVGALAERYGTSTNPVREALQQLRGEGFVQFNANRGARVRQIDDDFVRDIYEVAKLLEPYMTRWFVDTMTDEDITRLEEIQVEIEDSIFDDMYRSSGLDRDFHLIVYDRHYNRHAFDLWWRHREILGSLATRIVQSRTRREQVLKDHRELIECFKRHDADAAAEVIARHVDGAGRHLAERLRAERLVRREGLGTA